jgi:NitT/TauT family transport system substrate-binding protein
MKYVSTFGVLVALLSSANAADKITVGGNRLSAVAPVFIAKDKGFFDEQALDATLVNLTSAQAIGAAVASGEVQFGMTAFTAGIYTLAGKGALRIIAGGLEEAPGYKSVAVLASSAAYKSGLTKLADLAGRKVGITSVGSPNQYQAYQIARKYNFDYRSMQFVPLQTYGNLVSALKGNQVDFALLSTTMAIQAEQSGSKILAWMSDEERMQLGGIMAPTKIVSSQPGLVERFLRAYLKGLRYYHAAFQNDGPNGSRQKGDNYDEALGIIAKYTGETPTAVAGGLPYFDPNARISEKSIEDQISYFKLLNQTDPTVSAKAIIEPRFLAEASAR